jgi:gamma-glutamyltranspeptidase / glutathione hydrolase
MPEKGCDIAWASSRARSSTGRRPPNGKGGSMTLADLGGLPAAVREPIEGSYRGYRIKAMRRRRRAR